MVGMNSGDPEQVSSSSQSHMDTNNHSHSHTPTDNLRVSNSPLMHVFGLWEEEFKRLSALLLKA